MTSEGRGGEGDFNTRFFFFFAPSCQCGPKKPMTKEDSPAQVSKPNKWSRNVNGEASRNGFQSPANSNSPPFRAGSSPNAPPSSRQDPPSGRRRSDSPSTAATTEHSFEAQPPPPRRPPGQSTLSPDGPKNREFLVNHDWGDSSPTQEQPTSIVYKTCALTVWHEDGIFGFLCDGNVLYNNLHFYANGATLVEEEEDKRLNELASDRLQCGHRSNDLVYIHPTILLKSVLIGAMKQRLVSCRPAYVENALDVLHSNRTISGKVTVAPRWIGDTIGRMCNLKRVLISCEPCGDTSQAYGTVVETIGDTSVVIQTHSRSDRVYCSLISACSDPNVSLKVGSHVRYTACPNLPNSTYKWRCVNISKSSWVDSDDSKLAITLANASVDTKSEEKKNEIKSIDVTPTVLHVREQPEKEDNSCPSKRGPKTRNCRRSSSPLRMYRPIGYPIEADEPIPICTNENPRKVFRYGDEAHCHFTIPDDLERSQYANLSPLYKSMEDFLLRHKHRRGVSEDIGDVLSSLSKKKEVEPPKSTPPPLKISLGGRWYHRTKPRTHPTVVVAEFIENRDIEKDCSEDINVYRLEKTITIRNSGVFVDDGLFPEETSTEQNSISSRENETAKDGQPSILSLIQSDEVIGKFFDSLLKKS
ncbi:unnamed protein product [Nippostrongylus brasiliensis]|uniref:MH2 domain-containing protein n=1 Tax=Nippostrongylus brasiliensis TaxID=27835 RepID=A0A158QWF1_NIPBR|nr:unnamed protein product [Nippostrongylus brasiliensis]